MKTVLILAASLALIAPLYGQDKPQPPQQEVTVQPAPQVDPRFPRAHQIPNWDANKPAPIIPIPTSIQPRTIVLVNEVPIDSKVEQVK